MSITRKITLTAILLALALVFQAIRSFIPMPDHVSVFIISTLVNLCLFLSIYFVGFWFTLIIAVVTPVVALLQGHLAFPLFIPLVAAGNAIVIAPWAYLHTFRNWVSKTVCVIIGSTFKFGLLFYLGPLVFKTFIASSLPMTKQQIIMNVLSFNFSWPQLITALAGGFLAIVIGRALEKVVFEKV